MFWHLVLCVQQAYDKDCDFILRVKLWNSGKMDNNSNLLQNLLIEALVFREPNKFQVNPFELKEAHYFLINPRIFSYDYMNPHSQLY